MGFSKAFVLVQRLGLLAVANVRHSIPTAGLEAILGVMLLDLHTQCVVTQGRCRIWSRNRDRWDGIGCGLSLYPLPPSGPC